MRDLLQRKQRYSGPSLPPPLPMPALQHHRQDAEQQMPDMQDLSDFLHANQNWQGRGSKLTTAE